MSLTRPRPRVRPPDEEDSGGVSPAAVGLTAAFALLIAAMVFPAISGWDVRIGFPPVFAHWMPRVGVGSASGVVIALLGVIYGDRVTQRLSWPRLLIVTWLTGLAWLVSLALIDGSSGLSSHIDTDDFLHAAHQPMSVSHLLHGFVSRISLGPDAWPTHVAGHPPGALLFFVALVSVGLGGSLAVGLVVTMLASTIPLAVLTTVRELGDERGARLAAPFVVLAPAAIWEAVSGDAVYACVAAWALAVLAVAATSHSIAWSVLAGLLLGTCVMMSYGLALLGFLALAVLLAARSYRPLIPAGLAAVAVVVAFWVAGFALWDAYVAIHQRYWAGVASVRPASYWLWGDLAALCFSAGPVLGAAVACWVQRVWNAAARPGHRLADLRVITILGGGALCAVMAADVSLMSKAEVERIWLPFVPWLLLLCALLPARWRRPALALQVVSALVVQHLFVTGW